MANSEKADELVNNEGDKTRQSLTPPLNAAIISALLDAEVEEKQQIRRVVWAQVIATIIAASVTYGLMATPQSAMAVLSGGGVSVLISALMAWRMSQANRRTTHDAQLQLRLLYFYAAERLMVVVALLGLAMLMLKSPLAVLSGFVLGQAVLLIARLLLRNKTEDSE